MGERGVSDMLFLLLLAAAALYNLALVAVIWVKTRPGQPGRNLAWLVLALTAWIVGEAITNHPGVTRETTIWTARGMYVAATLMIAALLWFCSTFPTASRRFGQFALAWSAAGIPWLFISWTDAMVKDSTARPWGLNLVLDQRFGAAFGVWVLVGGAGAVGYLIARALKYRGAERLQVTYVLLGMAVTLVVGLVVNVVHPAITGQSTYSSFGPLSSIAITTTCTYAIVKYRLLDIRLILRTGLTYSLTIVILTLPFALLVPLFEGIVASYGVFPAGSGSFTFALAMALLFQPLRVRVEAVVAQYFLKPRYDYQETLEATTRRLAAALDTKGLGAVLVERMQETFHPAFVAVYVPTGSGHLALSQETGESGKLPREFAPEDMVIGYAGRSRAPLFVDEMMRERTGTSAIRTGDASPRRVAGERAREMGVELLVPLVGSDGTLGALVMVGQNVAGDAFTEGDAKLLRTLTSQCTLAIDNVRHYEELRALNLDLERRVRERTRELESANTKLREADRAKDKFLAMLSHELVSPLSTIIGWVDIARHAKSAEKITHAFGAIMESAQRQKYLVDELLDVSRIIHGKVTITQEPSNLVSLVEQAARAQEHNAVAADIVLRVLPHSEPLIANVDKVRIVQVVTNLLGNAIKFTPAAGTVTLGVERVGERARIWVVDDGPGIAREEIAAIFDPFHQTQTEQRREGLGLGLALVKGFTDLHGGTVSVSSPGVGMGSTFTVELPLLTASGRMLPRESGAGEGMPGGFADAGTGDEANGARTSEAGEQH